ncbi:origin recognition complex subunit orc1 [Neofusicoccum parvum]|uniref:Origin recognition complex subunit orc1 n=1 Tax=Neofusicoccum parvum TaxID=310453 RepID=A0ACB5RWK9_9PEZI|nr:origin recognition complex subunit orc1 [Neofusicoccum parvum]
MAPARKQTRTERARQWLKGGGVLREDSDDELGVEDHPWEWLYDANGSGDNHDDDNATPRKRAARAKKDPRPKRGIIGARMGNFECRIGDTVMLKAEGNEAWVGIVCDLFDGKDEDTEEEEKMANFMWFSTPKEIRNKARRRTDYMDNELYITAYFDDNPLTTINGRATVVSKDAFFKKYPSGKIPRTARDSGKLFVCQRGVNTRTATYTDIFRWEDVYSGEQDIASLMELVKSHTKETRKRKDSKKAKHDMDEFVAADEDEDAPQTPKKRRKLNDAITPTSKRKDLTPRKFITPTHKRIVVKKPLEFTPLGTRVLSPSEEELDDFIFVEINGMKVTDPHQSYSLLWEAIRGDRVSPAHALELLEREFSNPSPRRVPCVVLMDELDQLVTKNQSVMYNFFNWPNLRHSRLIVLAVANTMDLPERTLSNKISSRLGLTRITFPGYTHDQLMSIIQSRLANVPGNIVHPDAIQFASRKVAAVSGDARRALDICRRAVEIAEAASLDASAAAASNGVSTSTPNTPSKTPGRAAAAAAAAAAAQATTVKGGGPVVTIATIKQAIAEATSSPLQQALRALPLASKLFLAALLARVRRTGVQEALLGDVLDEARNLARMSHADAIQTALLGLPSSAPTATATTREPADAVAVAVDGLLSGLASTHHQPATPRRGRPPGAAKAAAAASRERGTVARVTGMGGAAVELMEAGIVGLEARRGERVGRVRLGVSDEEVRSALKDDEEVRGLGFG